MRARYDGIELLVAEHRKPFWFHYLQEAIAEESRFLSYLLVAFEIRVAENELQLILST